MNPDNLPRTRILSRKEVLDLAIAAAILFVTVAAATFVPAKVFAVSTEASAVAAPSQK